MGFHLFGHLPDPFTLYRAVSALPAGSTIWVDEGGVGAPRSFASIAGVLASARQTPSHGLTEAVRTSVLDSVRHHLVADVEVGAFLSAGVDSGALVGLMRDAGQARIRTLTLAFSEFAGTPGDEAPLAEAVAAHYGTDHTTRRVDRAEFLADLPAIFDAMDQPSIDGINAWFISKAAREGGAEGRHIGAGRRRAPGRLPLVPGCAEVAAPFRAPGADAGARQSWWTAFSVPRRRGLPGIIPRPSACCGSRAIGPAPIFLLRRAVLLPFELGEVLDEGVVRAGMERLDPLGLLRSAMTPDPGSDVGRVAALEASSYMKNQLLRDADWAGMAHGVEVRTPLVDYDVLKALAPYTAALTAQAGKRALAAAPVSPLPPEICERPKSGFAVPVRAWTTGETARPHRLDSRPWAKRVLDHTLSEGVS